MFLKDRTAAITGSTSGIGLAYARALAKEGANLVINGIMPPADAEKLRSDLEAEFGVKAVFSPADMTKPAEIAGFIAEGEKAFGAVDILINNAGIQYVAPIDEFPLDKWDQIIAINLSSAFHTIRAALPKMKEKGWGRIINTASAHALVASPFKSAYVAAKHGIAGLTKTVALEVATKGITVNAIAPGYVWDAAGREADPRHDEGPRPHPRAGHQRRDAGRAADQGLRHGRTGRGACRLPLHRRGEVDHGRDPAHRRRLDRRVSGRSTRRPEPVKGLVGPKAEKTISLALQGGGAHGAFTWGVLDVILEDGRLGIEALTGTSAGAMNAVVLAEGWIDGGRRGTGQARSLLAGDQRRREVWRLGALAHRHHARRLGQQHRHAAGHALLRDVLESGEPL